MKTPKPTTAIRRIVMKIRKMILEVFIIWMELISVRIRNGKIVLIIAKITKLKCPVQITLPIPSSAFSKT
jgi:hypothetical protein